MKEPITNRRGQRMFARFETADSVSPQGLAIYQHGYGNGADSILSRSIAESFRLCGFDTLTLDCTHSFNESDGDLEGNTIETHWHDLCDAIDWARRQSWFSAPFALAGHSLGGFTTAFYAQNHPQDVSLLCPLAAVVSGEKLFEAYQQNMPAEDFEDWRRRGYQMRECIWNPDAPAGRQPFSWLTGMAAYSLLEKADSLTMPVLMIVGERDIPTPPEHQRLLFDRISAPKAMHVIKGSDHCYTAPAHLAQVRSHLENFLKAHAV